MGRHGPLGQLRPQRLEEVGTCLEDRAADHHNLQIEQMNCRGDGDRQPSGSLADAPACGDVASLCGGNQGRKVQLFDVVVDLCP